MVRILDEQEYFEKEAISASQIKAFDRGAYWFWKSSPFNKEKDEESETDALVFGKLAHCVLLEPEAVDERFIVEDFGLSRKNKKYAELKGTTDKIIVSPAEMERAKKMVDAIKCHKLAGDILFGATCEKPFSWVEDGHKYPFKAKVDAIKRTKAGIVVVDYKTSSDIDGVLNWGQKLQYPLQADFYCRAVKAKYGEEPIEFVFIIQSNKEGEEDVIAVANVEYETMQVAHDIVDRRLEEIEEKLDMWFESGDKNIWSAYPNRVEIRYSNWFMERGND